MNQKLGVDRHLYDCLSASMAVSSTKEEIGSLMAQAENFCRRGSILKETYEKLGLLAQEALNSFVTKESVRKEVLKEKKISELFRDTDEPILFFSHKLGEQILLVKDGWTPPEGETRVWYQQSEMKQIVGWNTEEVRALHALKKAFNGVVEAPSDHSRGSRERVVEAEALTGKSD